MSFVMNTQATCRVCAKQYSRHNTLQVVCGVRCAQRIPIINRKEADADMKRRRDAIKPRAKWMAEAQAAVNKYARLRDIRQGYGCITCGAPYSNKYGGGFDAGHMHSRGSSPHLRFRLDNIALQCVKENRYLGGLSIQFREAMVERHGLVKIEALESIHGPAKFSIDYLRRLKQVFAKKARRMEKRLEMQD